MATMTIHRALSELKLIDAKIEKQINDIRPSGMYQKDKLIDNITQKDEFEKNAKSAFNSVLALIERKTKIKTAIVKANGETMVKVGEKDMTIADAITYKATVKFKKKLSDMLKVKHRSVVGVFNKNTEIVNANVQTLLEKLFGKENVKVSDTDLEAVRKPYLEVNSFHLFDPLDVEKAVEKIDKEVAEFESEVDAVLSEINAVTLIEIE